MPLDQHPRIATSLLAIFFVSVVILSGWLIVTAVGITLDVVAGVTPMAWGDAGISLVAAAAILTAATAGVGLHWLARLVNLRARLSSW